MDSKQNNSRLLYYNDDDQAKDADTNQYILWVHGSWFPPFIKSEHIYNGRYTDNLLQAPTSE
jgi:hypothetical protein